MPSFSHLPRIRLNYYTFFTVKKKHFPWLSGLGFERGQNTEKHIMYFHIFIDLDSELLFFNDYFG